MSMYVCYSVRGLLERGEDKALLRKHLAQMHGSLYKNDLRHLGDHCTVSPNNCDTVAKFRQYLNSLVESGQDSSVMYWVVWYGREPIGFAKVIDYGMSTTPRDFYIELMYVKKKYRGEGIGTELIRCIKSRANYDSKAPFVVSVGVACRNEDAIDFYKKNHFLPTSMRMQMFCDKIN